MEQWEGTSKAAIGRRLELTREVLGLQQNEFCEQARIATNAYNQYERGHKRPSLDNALRLCEAFGLSLDWIYRGHEDALRFSLGKAIKALKEERMANPRPAARAKRTKVEPA